MKNKKCPERKLCFGYKDDGCGDCAFGMEITKLHKRIDRLKKQNEKLTIERNAWALIAKHLTEDGKWISVDLNLPCESEYVLVYYGCGMAVVQYSTKHKMFNTRDDATIDEAKSTAIEGVTHWMPLTPPKGGETEDEQVH